MHTAPADPVLLAVDSLLRSATLRRRMRAFGYRAQLVGSSLHRMGRAARSAAAAVEGLVEALP